MHHCGLSGTPPDNQRYRKSTCACQCRFPFVSPIHAHHMVVVVVHRPLHLRGSSKTKTKMNTTYFSVRACACVWRNNRKVKTTTQRGREDEGGVGESEAPGSIVEGRGEGERRPRRGRCILWHGAVSEESGGKGEPRGRTVPQTSVCPSAVRSTRPRTKLTDPRGEETRAPHAQTRDQTRKRLRKRRGGGWEEMCAHCRERFYSPMRHLSLCCFISFTRAAQ